jgi:Fe-S-cluster containining protein
LNANLCMSGKNKEKTDASGGLAVLPAGNFSEWLRGAQASLRSGKSEADVPCGACTACCRSSMFIHSGPEETRTIRRIPRALLFPAPGLPRGHVVMGYSDNGCCPMLVDNKCSIYEYRPQTCRSYDCRVFTATGVAVGGQTQPEIAHRVKAWVFNYESEQSRQEHRIVREAASFLQKNWDLFPPGSLPDHPAQLAALAVGIYGLFSDMTTRVGSSESAMPDAVIVRAIMTALNAPETSSRNIE